jgi:hypothetical protein
MRHRNTHRSPWHDLSVDEKQARLSEMRRRQQAQIEVEARRLRAVR